MSDGKPYVTQGVGQCDTNDCHFQASICLSDQIRDPLYLCLQPMSPVDSIGKFFGERLVTSQYHPGPRLMPGMQL